MSILLQAKEQEEFLGKPVVPVFWIAGEDHDFEEINHIFAYQNSRFKKLKLQSNSPEKTPVSSRKIDVTELNNWLDEVFSTLNETSYSKELYQLIKSSYSHDDSYVDFLRN